MHPFSLSNLQAKKVSGGISGQGELAKCDPLEFPTTIVKEDGGIGDPVTQKTPEDGFGSVFFPELGPVK